jgi:hypothetical protein
VVAAVLAEIERRIVRLLRLRGLVDADPAGNPPDAWGEEAPILAGIAAAPEVRLLAARPRICGPGEVRRMAASGPMGGLS